MSDFSFTGFGIGLRPVHYQSVLDTRPAIDWFEIISEDYMIEGGEPLRYLDLIRQDYPMAMHGVSLSLGSSDPLNKDYLRALKKLTQRVDPLWVSDHLCWTGVNGVNIHDLMPLPYTEEALEHVVARIQTVQDLLGSQILIENVSSYIQYRDSVMTEWEFLSAIAEKADCFILLDINNVYVNAYNHSFNPEDYFNGIPEARVLQFHIAGHDHCKTHLVDTHDSPVLESVWDLYSLAIKHFKTAATLIERDAKIPSLEHMVEELNYARKLHQAALCESAA